MSDQPLDMDDLQTAWVDFMCDHSNRALSYEEAVEAFATIMAAHDAAIRADEREKAALEAIVRAFKVMRAHEFMVRSILSKEDEPDSEQAAKAVVAYLIHAVDMDAENAAAARGDGAE